MRIRASSLPISLRMRMQDSLRTGPDAELCLYAVLRDGIAPLRANGGSEETVFPCTVDLQGFLDALGELQALWRGVRDDCAVKGETFSHQIEDHAASTTVTAVSHNLVDQGSSGQLTR